MGYYLIADNQELTSFAIQSLLKRDAQNVISHASHKRELMQYLEEHENSIVLLDFSLFDIPDEETLLIISERFSMASWVLISNDFSEPFLKKVIYSSHVFSVVFKDDSMKAVRDAILYASQGKRYISQQAVEMITQHKENEVPQVLTNTEIEIVKAIAHGKTTKEIANERFSSVHTINTHRKNIFRKLGIGTAHEAVKYALRMGWVDSSEFYI